MLRHEAEFYGITPLGVLLQGVTLFILSHLEVQTHSGNFIIYTNTKKVHVFLGRSLKNKVVNPQNESVFFFFLTSGVVLVSVRSPPNAFTSVVLLPVSMFVASPHCLYMKEQLTFVEAAPLINITVPTVVHTTQYHHHVQWRIQETNNGRK